MSKKLVPISYFLIFSNRCTPHSSKMCWCVVVSNSGNIRKNVQKYDSSNLLFNIWKQYIPDFGHMNRNWHSFLTIKSKLYTIVGSNLTLACRISLYCIIWYNDSLMTFIPNIKNISIGEGNPSYFLECMH